MTSMGDDVALPILKRCFPGADNLRIVDRQVEDGQRHGTSDVIRLIVEYEREARTRRQHLVLKVPISGHAISSWCESLDMYALEINMYENVWPLLNRHLPQRLSPAHFHTTDSKILALEDLTARGYRSGEKLGLLDYAQTAAAMKAYAQFHAASYKVAADDPLVVENFAHPNFENVDCVGFVRPWQAVVLELLRRKREDGLMAKVEAAVGYFREHGDTFTTLSDRSNFEFVVLSHGGSRKENCLFKREPDGRVQVQLLDFQGCFWTSPVYDVGLFLSSSVEADVLEAHFDDLVRGYLDELNARLAKLECGNAYLRADFDRDFKALKFNFFYGFLVLCAINSPTSREQLLDIIDQSVKGGGSYEHLYDLCLNDEQFVRPVYRWLKYLEKSNFLDQF